MASTTSTTIERPTTESALRFASFGRTGERAHVALDRRETRDVTSPSSAPRAIGSSAVRHPRRDLRMFSETAEPVRIAWTAPPRCEKLAPLLPPVESDPLRTRRVTRAVVSTEAAASVSAAAGRERLRTPGRPTGRLRLTMRGYGVLLGLAVAAIAGTSAISVSAAAPSASVGTLEVVARPGESVGDLAQRAAQGRDVAALADAIEAANGLADGAVLQGGDVIVVPGR